MKTTQERIHDHAEDEFGHRNIATIGLKFGEEAGEVLKAVNRLHEQRGDIEEVKKELGDVFVVANVLAQQLGFDLQEVQHKGAEDFLVRHWNNVRYSNERDWWDDDA